ncbi:amidophosphoribosyltransferase [Mangrovibacterium diazotrophicum]|uniref:Amidophosphoribosyltransferase n=1 Tax=Mangrovibacterium diazotrophicum TaxID=1261403 RepID=A0A419W3L0_9BACT|nr:amidophosphoribosyltransferase [Mangrovibacterium diazotrophicum]RKD90024.1 hypothetical protein BC643_0360 [Mangrovibacterium diazotrophicum]
MKHFSIEPNRYLNQSVDGFHHANFYGCKHPDNPNFLYKLKNDPHHNWSQVQVASAKRQLEAILTVDLPVMLNSLGRSLITVCVVPRAKTENSYRPDQLLFRAAVQNVIKNLIGFEDGTNFIHRNKNTKTTHLRLPVKGMTNDGALPYPGITHDTCSISNSVLGKDILLIDDIYTKTINIDEDAIQALLNAGAHSVTFYAIAYTVSKY